MKIRVTDVNTRADSQELWVAFSTVYGSGQGWWKGEPPITEEEYEVEVELEEIFVWGSNIISDNSHKPRIKYANDTLFIRGILESTDSDGYTVMRLGDSLLPFLAEGVPSTFTGPIEISVTAMLLYEVLL